MYTGAKMLSTNLPEGIMLRNEDEPKVRLLAPKGQYRTVLWDLEDQGRVHFVEDHASLIAPCLGAEVASVTKVILVYNDQGQIVRTSRQL